MAQFLIQNVPQVHNLNRFISVVNKYGVGLAQACRFMVIIGPTKSQGYDTGTKRLVNTIRQEMSFLCEQAEIPGKSLATADARHYGPNYKFPYQSVYTDATFSFLVRDEMLEKQYFDNWLMSINPNSTYDFQYPDDYRTDIDVVQYSARNKGTPENPSSLPTYKVTLKRAYPISVQPMGLVWGEENFHRIQVQFAYTEWKKIDDPVPVAFDLVNVKNGAVIVNQSTLDITNTFRVRGTNAGDP